MILHSYNLALGRARAHIKGGVFQSLELILSPGFQAFAHRQFLSSALMPWVCTRRVGRPTLVRAFRACSAYAKASLYQENAMPLT
eukprot:1156086-Pelagomonas_calceolata.AAC.2